MESHVLGAYGPHGSSHGSFLCIHAGTLLREPGAVGMCFKPSHVLDNTSNLQPGSPLADTVCVNMHAGTTLS